MWSLDLNKLNGFKCLKELTTLPKDMRPEASSSDDDSEWEEASDDGEDQKEGSEAFFEWPFVNLV